MYAGALCAEPIERRMALQRAREHGLDVPRMAIVMADRTIERALDSLPLVCQGPATRLVQEPCSSTRERRKCCSSGRLSGPRSRPTRAGTGEMYLLGACFFLFWSRLRLLTWIVVFQARGTANVGRLLLDMQPPELAAISTPVEHAAEYLDYCNSSSLGRRSSAAHDGVLRT
jgi:nuclear pore complex protein Nup107